VLARQIVQEGQWTLAVVGLLPALLTSRLMLQLTVTPVSWWLCKPTQKLEDFRELEFKLEFKLELELEGW